MDFLQTDPEISSLVPDDTLRARAQEAYDYTRRMLSDLDSALKSDSPEDREWLQRVCNPTREHMRPFAEIIMYKEKYHCFPVLMGLVLRAVQLIVRITCYFIAGLHYKHTLGLHVLTKHLSDDKSALMQRTLHRFSHSPNCHVAISSITLLAELGPKATPLDVIPRCLDMLLKVEEKAKLELIEVVLRFHSWSDSHRFELEEAIVSSTEAGQQLCHSLLKVMVRCDKARCTRACKLLSGCLDLEPPHALLTPNCANIWVEMIFQYYLAVGQESVTGGEAVSFLGCYKRLLLSDTSLDRIVSNHIQDQVQPALHNLKERFVGDPEVYGLTVDILAILA